MKRNTILIFSFTALTLSACGDDDGRSTDNDAGNDANVMQDSTINTPDSSTEDDASTVDNRTRTCGMNGPSLREVFDEPRCEQATRDCIEACEGETQQEILECVNACIQADETAPRTQGALTIDCGFCLSYEPFICLYDNGCDTAIANFTCCVEDKCAGLTGEAAQNCANAMCAAEGQAQNVCFQQNQASCASSTDSCYPSAADGDAGTADAAVDGGADAGTDGGA